MRTFDRISLRVGRSTLRTGYIGEFVRWKASHSVSRKPSTRQRTYLRSEDPTEYGPRIADESILAHVRFPSVEHKLSNRICDSFAPNCQLILVWC